MNIFCLQHFEPEEAGLIGAWASESSHPVTTIRLYNGDALPELEPDDALVVMGGPMNVDEHDKYAWLAPEKKLIEAHIRAGGRVFGVCLGGQLIACALGAPVTRGREKEIGWWKIRFTPEALAEGPFEGFEQEMSVLQWHGDTFGIPAGAQHLASSEVCQNQAFTVNAGRVIALQFHFEAESKEVHDFVEFFDAELKAGGPYVQEGPEIIAALDEHAESCKKVLYTLLDRWAKS